MEEEKCIECGRPGDWFAICPDCRGKAFFISGLIGRGVSTRDELKPVLNDIK